MDGQLDTTYAADEFAAECAKIRLAYPWLEERTIEHFAAQALTNKHKK